MFTPIIKISLCLALCYWLLSCKSQTCEEYQDVARVDLYELKKDNSIDSVVMKASYSESVLGCRNNLFNIPDVIVVGSKTHRMKFPINVRIQLFSKGNLLKELFFEIDKKTVSKVYYGISCSDPSKGPPKFLTDDYCLYIENMGDLPGYDYKSISCVKLSTGDKKDICKI